MSFSQLNSVLEPVSIPIANALGLPRLPGYFGAVTLSFLGFQTIERILSPLIFRALSPENFGKASKQVQQGWVKRACSMVHALTAVYLASRAISRPEITQDRLRGTHHAEGIMAAFSAGFIWDVMEESIFHYQDPAFVIHGILVLSGLALTFRPLFPYTSVSFVFQEISTPFLNIHWFLDKTNRTGSTLQLINGILLISAFFLARICFGSLATFRFYKALMLEHSRPDSTVSAPLFWAYLSGAAALQFMNWFWMYKMIAALRKRFSGNSNPKKFKSS